MVALPRYITQGAHILMRFAKLGCQILVVRFMALDNYFLWVQYAIYADFFLNWKTW